MIRNLFDRLARTDRSKSRRNKTRKARRGAFQSEMMHQMHLETLEDRRMLAAYDWDGAGTLSITLAQDEDLTIAEAGGNRTFTIDTGTFTATNVVEPTGDGTNMLTFDAGEDISTMITVNNTGAAAGTNNVTFDGGTITSNTITVNANQAGTTSAIDFATAGTVFGAAFGTLNLTANGAGITDSTGHVDLDFFPTTLTLSASGQAIVLDNPLNDFDVRPASNVVLDASSLTIVDADSISFGNLSVTGAVDIDATGSVFFDGSVTAGSLAVTAPGAVTDNGGPGSLTITGATTLDAGAAFINLTNPINDFQGVVTITAADDALLDDTNAITFGAITVTDELIFDSGGNVDFTGAVVADDLDVDTTANSGSTGGAITDTGGSLAITTSTALDGGDQPITLDNAANDLGDDLTTLTTNANQVLADANGLASVEIAAGTGNVSLNSGGPLQDADGAVDIVADDLILTAAGGIGMFGSELGTDVNRMDVSNATADQIFITDSAGGLVLTDLGGPNGNAVDAAGGGSITANSPLTIAADAISSGGMGYTALEGGPADDLIVDPGVTVQDTTAGLTLNAGDNLLISTGSTVTAGTTLVLNLDAGDDDGDGETADIFGTIAAATLVVLNGSPDANFFNIDDNGGAPNDGGTVDNVQTNLQIFGNGGDDTLDLDDSGDTTGDTVVISNDGPENGTITGLVQAPGDPSIAFNGVWQVNLDLGDTEADTVTVTPNEGTAFALNGNDPTTTPGDTLVFDLPGPTATLTLVPNSTGFDGMLTAPGVDNIVFDNFESFDTTGVTFDVVLDVNGGDMAADGTADETRLELVGMDLQVTVDDGTNAPSFQLPLGAILSLQVVGSADDDILRIVDNGDGVPSFPGMALSAHSNPAFEAVTGKTATDIGIDFDAGGGINALGLDLTAANVAYFSDSVGLPSSGVVSVDAAGAGGIGEFAVSFNQLAPIGIFVAGPGSLLVDASANPAVASLAVDDDAYWALPVLPLFTTFPLPLPGVPGDGISMIYEPTGAAGFETVQFTGFSDVTVRSGPGPDLIDVIALDNAGPGAAITDLILDGDSSIAPDASDDTIRVQTLPAGVTATLMGGPDSGAPGDLYLLDNLFARPRPVPPEAIVPSPAGALDAVLGLVVANPVMSPSPAFPAPEEGGVETLTIVDLADTTADTIVVTATTIDGITGAPAGPPAGITYGPGPGGDIVETVNMSTGMGGDTVNVQSTAMGSTHNYFTGPGDDTVNISSDAPANAGDLNGIDGQINLNTGGGAGDVLNLSDAGDGTADTYVFGLAGPATTIDFADGSATPDITFNAPFGPADQLETFNITGGTGNDTFTNFVAAGGTALTAMMFATTNNTFNGNAGNDTFDFEWSDGFNLAAGTNFVINGGNPASSSENRDAVTLDTTADTGGARTIGITYVNATSGDVDVTGLRGGGGIIDINTTETLFYDGGGTVDPVTVTGTSADDDLTVALRDTNNAALVFRGGNPYLQAPPDSISGSLPGVAGGGSGPDISLNGIDDTLTLDGGGNTGAPGLGDRAIVYAASEAAITTGGTLDVFGFGNGVLIPGFGAGNAWDEIDVNNTTGAEDFSPAEVDVRNNNFGQLVSVDIVEATFDQAGAPASAERPALIVNGGDEAMARPSGVSDRFFAAPSALFNIQVNGNLPSAGPVGPDGFPIGDELTLVSPVSINVFSDKATPPNVSTTFGNNIFGVRDSSIERKRLLPGNGVLNLIGDNNDPAVDQADNFVVVGRDVDSGGSPDAGFQEMTLRINGSAPILIDNVSDMNVYGFDLVGEADLNAPNPNRADAGAGGIDTLDISPYADDTPRGWGVDVLFNEGLPAQVDGAQADLLIVHTSFFGGQVSEDITIRPSGMDAGEVIITNSSFGTPIADIDYIGNTDIIVLDDDGFANDTDTLTMLGTNPDNPGTSGNETINADFTAAGGVGTPWVNVLDGATILYNVRNFMGFDTVNFATLDGDDTLNLTPDSANANGLQNLVVNYDGGDPVASDTLNFNANANARVTQGADPTTGLIDNAGVGDVNYSNVELVGVTSATAASTLTVRGTNDEDTIAIAPTAVANEARVWVNQGATVTANNGGANNNFATVDLHGRFGSDDFSITPIANVAITAQGMDPTASDSAVVNISGATILAPSASDAATVTVVGLGQISLQTIEHGTIVGTGNSLSITGTAVDDDTVYDATGDGSGSFTSDQSPAFTFQGITALTAFGGAGGFDQLRVITSEGPDTVTSTNDTIMLTGGGQATSEAGIDQVELLTLGGDDNIDLDLNLAGVNKIVDAGAGNDMVDMTGTIDATIFGGLGNDIIVGSPLADLIFGGPGDDSISGLAGNDIIYGEAGNDAAVGGTGSDLFFGGDGSDTFSWFQGDGSDVIEGDGGGADAVVFNGANVGELSPEVITVSANNGRVVFTRGITLNMAGVERLDVNGVDAPDPMLGGVETITVNDLGTTELAELNIDLQGNAMPDGVADSVTVNAPATDDNIAVTQSGTTVNVSGLGYDINVTGAVIAENDLLTINANGGNDTISVGAGVEADIDLSIDGGAGNDVIDGSQTVVTAGANITLAGGIGNDTLIGGGADETLNGNAGDDVIHPGGGANTVDGGTGDDQYIPGGGTDTITDGGGTDSIVVEGTPGNDAITVGLAAGGTDLTVTINGVTTTYPAIAAAGTGIETLLVEGQEGDDTLTVDSTNGAIPLVQGIEFNGGDGSDGLTLTGGMATANVYSVGADVGSGVSQITIGGVTQTVTFTGLEPVINNVAGPLTINATAADNSINYSPTGANGLVEIDNFESIQFANKTNVTINAGAGSDAIHLSATASGYSGTMTVDGGDNADGDTLQVTGAANDAADAVNWTPTPATEGDGALTVLGGTINVLAIETLIYDGESDGDTVTVTGSAAADSFAHQPGEAVDAGFVGVRTGGGEMLGLNYENLGDAGTITAAGGGGVDSLTALATGDSDTVAVSFTAADAIDLDLTSAYGTHVDLLTVGVTNFVIDTLEGDDNIDVTAPVSATGFDLRGGGPGGSDTLNLTGAAATLETVTIIPDATRPGEQDITGLGAQIDVSGVEAITYDGTGGDDTLTVDPGPGDHSVRVDNGPGAFLDRVISDSLPLIRFTDLNTFQVTSLNAESLDATFKLASLDGATNYEFLGDVQDTLIVEGLDGAADTVTVTNPAAAVVSVTDTSNTVVVPAANALGRLQVNGLGGDDTVTVDVDAGTPSDVIGVPITFDGGLGSDVLVVTGAPATAVDEVIYSPGPDVTEGRLRYENAADAPLMTIDFANLEPVVDAVVAANLTVNGTNADNAINYSAGVLDPAAHGLISVDAFETIEFTNKTNLTINGNAGDDVINLNNPGTPTNLAQINVNGNDPTASDTVIVNGTAGLDAIVVDQYTNDGARIVGAEPVTIMVDTAEHLQIVGQGGNDTLTVTTPAGGTLIDLTDGVLEDNGSIEMRQFAGDAVLPTGFSALGFAGTLTFSDAGGGRADELVLNATDPSNTGAIFNVSMTGTVDLESPSTGGNVQELVLVMTPGIDLLRLNAFEGDDTFNIPGDHPFTRVFVHGGSPGSGSDVLDFTGAGAAVTVDLGAETVTETGFGPVDYSGVETIDLNAGTVTPTIEATSGDDDITVTPADANSGTVEHGYAVQQNGQVDGNTVAPLINYSNTGGNPVNINLDGGEDTLVVVGNTLGDRGAAPPAPQEITVDVPTSTITVDDDPNVAGTNGTVTYLNNESLSVFGLEGDDTFNVTAGAIPVFIDGGDPIGQNAGDEIVIIGGGAVVSESGPENDEGGIIVDANARISYDHIEAITVAMAAKAIILGTNDDDDISIIARTELANPNQFVGADGVQDFTSSVNDGPDILWLDTPLVFVDGLNGDDDITVRAPAPPVPGPNPAVWNVDVYVAGGPPSAPTNGDQLRVETPYENNSVTYQPTSPDTGIMNILNAGGATQSNIYIGPWEVDCDGNPATTDDIFRSSPGGVEELHYDGISAEGGFTLPDPTNPPPNQNPATAFNDTVRVLGDGFAQAPTNDHFTHTPGNDPDAGRVDVVNATNAQSMLALKYTNIGLGGSVTIDGGPVTDMDLLRVLGTDQNDVIGVDATTGTVRMTLSNAAPRVPILQIRIESLVLDAAAGDDTTTINQPQPYTSIAVNGGQPDNGSDVLTVIGAAATAENVVIAQSAINSTNQTITGYGAPIAVSGKERIEIVGQVADPDTLNVNLGEGDNTARVERGAEVLGANADVISSDSLPDIGFTGLDNFTATGGSGADVVTFATWFLAGANDDYRFNGGATDALVIEGVDGSGPGNDSYTVTNPAMGGFPVDPPVQVTDNNGTLAVVTAVNTVLGRLQINTLGGDDTVTVDVDTAGSGSDVIGVPITFDGGAGHDLLADTGTAATAVDELIYSPGAEVTAGRLTYEDAADDTLMLIDFVNLEPVASAIAVPTITVGPLAIPLGGVVPSIPLDADNAINYEPSPLGAGVWSRVSIDAYESIHFTNKDNLIINAGAGNDVVNLNDPLGYTAFTAAANRTITVRGDDPTDGSDTLISNGVLNMDDAIIFTPTAGTDDAGSVTGAGPVPIAFSTVELLKINGQGGDGAGVEDTLTVATPAATSSTIEVTPGATVDSGNVQVDSLVPMEFNNLDARGQLLISDPDAVGTDTLVYNGTSAADVFTVPDGAVPAPSIALNNQIGVGTTNVDIYRLRGLGGDDVFNITPQANVGIRVDGDGPGGSDLLNFFVDNTLAAPRNIAVALDNTPTPDPSQQTIQQQTLGLVTLSGIETANIEATANVSADNLVIAGTRFDDLLTYTARSANEGTVTSDLENVVINFNNFEFDRAAAEDTFTLTGGVGGFADKVVVVGTQGRDLIQVDSPNRTVIPSVLPFAFPSGPGTANPQTDWRAVVLNDGAAVPFGTAGNIETLTVSGRDGDDTVHVVPAPVVAAASGGLFVNVDGGQPQASDALVITNLNADGTPAPLATATDFVIINKSRIPDAGNVLHFRNAVRNPGVAYTNVEVVSPNFGLPALPDPDSTNANLLVMGPDQYEQNEDRLNAAYLGSGASINVQDLAIFPNVNEHPGVPADVDYFRVVAEQTGTLDFQVYFNSYDPMLLPQGGQLEIDVLDSAGNVIAGANQATNAFGGPLGPPAAGVPNPNTARVRIPAVQGQTYYVRVFGANVGAAPVGQDPAVVNGYDMTITNEAPPVPYDIELNDILQVGTTAAGATVNSIPTSSITPANPVLGAPTVANDYIGKTIEFTSGANIGRQAVVAAFAAGTFTVGSGLVAAPAAGDTFIVETTDTGRSQFDNVTRDATPIITFRLDDDILLLDVPGDFVVGNPPDGVIPIPFNTAQTLVPGPVAVATAGYRVPVFVEGNPQQPGTAPQTPIGYARPLAGTPGVYVFDFGVDAVPGATALTLTDGSHFISAKVEIIDPSIDAFANDTAFGDRSVSLEIVVDTTDPTLAFGDPAVAIDGLHPDSDSGDQHPLAPGTRIDRITNDVTPTFWGQAEADAIIRAFVDITDNGLTPDDVIIGQTVATPIDGTNQHPWGQWEITSTVDMNDPVKLAALPFDGTRNIIITAEDPAGNVNGDNALNTVDLAIFVDTQGPQVTGNPFISTATGIAVPSQNGGAFDLFALKPDNAAQGPTPLVNNISIPIRDLPARTAAFIYQAVSTGPPAAVNTSVDLPLEAVVVQGDANGVIPIQSIVFRPTDNGPGIATGNIIISFVDPLPDDRFTLRINDENVIDPAGNQLNGENNAAEPTNPTYPTGDGRPGGDFLARFTVDSRPEIGVWAAGSVWLDINGNSYFDPTNPDFVNRDLVFTFGNGVGGTQQAFTSDDFLAGDFNGNGFDELAVYGAAGPGITNYRWLVDTTDNGAPDLVVPEPRNINGLPVAGNFDGNAANGDEVGLFTGTTWWFDDGVASGVAHDFMVDTSLASNLRGLPIVGDFDDDGTDDLATYNNDNDQILIDLSSIGGLDGNIDAAINFGFIGIREKPVAADMNRDGIDDFGLYAPDRAGQNPVTAAEWYFLISSDAGGGPAPLPNFPQLTSTAGGFSPTPLGVDVFAQFGNEFALPIVGNFDPPPGDEIGNGGNQDPPQFIDPYDANRDGVVTPADVLYVVNRLNETGGGPAEPLVATEKNADTNQDLFVTPADALVVINHLNAEATAEGEGEGFIVIPAGTAEADPTAILEMDAAEGEGSVPQFGSFTLNARSSSDSTIIDTVSRDEAIADLDAEDSEEQPALPLAARNARANLSASTAHDELFAEVGIDEDLFDSLAHDVSNRQGEDDVDRLWCDLS